MYNKHTKKESLGKLHDNLNTKKNANGCPRSETNKPANDTTYISAYIKQKIFN